MFKPVGAKNDVEYIAMLNDERREQIEFMDNLIKQAVPGMKRYFAHNMLGYGKFKYKNSKKEELDWPVIALASQKNYISLYICAVDGNEYVAEKYKDTLGRVDVGKSCIRFKMIDDLDLDAVKQVLIEAEKNPGLVYSNDEKSK